MPGAASAEVARLAAQLHDMGARLADLRAENERLRAEMDVRTRRRDGLLGERAQLEKQLAQRDRRLADLEREVGALRGGGTATPRVGRPGLAGLIAAARRLLEPLGGGRGGPAAAGAAGAPPVPGGGEAPLVPFATERRAPRVLAVAVFGLGPEELERVVELVSGGLPPAGAVVPLFLTDCGAFEVFRARRAVFEYLPPPDQRRRFAPDLDWDLYVLRRLALLRRKWRPVRIIAFGPAARAVLAEWRACRFEDEDILALIHATEDGGAPAAGVNPARMAGG